MMLTLENWSTLLVRSRLHSPENARSLCERWRSEAGTAAEPRDFVRWLLTHGHLTQYQARLLSQGRVEGLFLGPYKLLERINQGRMAGAFQAIHETSLEPAVIKVMQAERAKDPLLLARFQREAKLATQLAHPSIVRVLQTGEAGGLHYVALEPVEGATLQEVLQERGRLPVRDAVHIANQICLALEYLHEKALVHRELKPSNVLLHQALNSVAGGASSSVKLLDVVLGRRLFDASSAKDSEEWTTPSGVRVSATDYLAPEQAGDARRADIRADLFSVGCMLYHMLSGQPPGGKQAKLGAEVPDGLSQVVMKMLSKDSGQRYATPQQAAEALKPFLSFDPDAIGPAKSTTGMSSRDVRAAVPEGLPVGTRAKRVARPESAQGVGGAATPFEDSGRATQADSFDIEPVSAVDLAMEFFRFRSRDWFMIAIGALLGGALVALVWLIVAIAGGPPSESSP